MNFSALAHLRLVNQQISTQKFSTPAALTSWMGGLQAQDYPAVRWALALRLKGKVTDAGIERAIANKTILRTWCMRGTIHLVAARDAAWMIGVTSPRPLNSAKPVERFAGLDEATFAKSNKLLARELKGGPPMERDTIYALFEKSGISITGQRGYYLLWRAGMTGLICFGPQLNKKPTFALLEDYVPRDGKLKPELAAPELARRYFQSRGPASVADWIWWSGLAPAVARAAHEEIRGELVEEKIDGQSYWMPSSKAGSKGADFFLLPGFDEFVLGYKDRSAVLDPRFASGIAYSNGIFFPTMVSKGRIVGIWRRSVKKGTVSLVAQPFEKLPRKEEGLFNQASKGYARFLGLELA